MKLIIDAKLDGGQHIQSRLLSDRIGAAAIARDMALRQMVVSADMLDTETGEVLLVFTRFTVRNYIRAHHGGNPWTGSGGISPA